MILKKITYLFFLYTVISIGQTNNFRFDHLTTQLKTVDDGLSSNTVLCVLQDSRGFIWIGTYSGLNRYDGYNIKVYKNIEGDESSLGNGFIKAMCEDNEGNLWIGTSESGLSKFIRKTERFKRFSHNFNDPQSLSNNEIESLCKDTSGNIWVGTAGGGLNLFDIKSEKFKSYTHNKNNQSSISNNIIYSLLVDKNGTLWIGTHNGGLDKFDRINDQFISYRHKPDDPSTICSDYITSLYEDHAGYLWVGSKERGLDKFDRNNNKFIHFVHDPNDESSISSNYVRVIYEDSENKLWVGTDDSGINLLDRSKSRFIRILNNFTDPEGLNNNSIYSILEDKSGILWFGTWSGGLNKYDKSKAIFRNYFHDPADKNSLANNEVYAIYVDKNDELWIGTSTSGLDRFDRSRKKVTHYKHNAKAPYSISNNYINSVDEDVKGYLWIGTNGGGLNRFDRRTEKFIHYKNEPHNRNSISSNLISQILCDRQGNIWIGVAGSGVDKYIPEENKFIHYEEVVDNKYVNNQPMVYSIYEDSGGGIWIGTYGGGISRYDKKGDRFKSFIYDSLNQNLNIVPAILQDHNGNYWAGTSGGIIKFTADKKEFKYYTKKDGLADDIINGILEDNSGNLWISTMKGISRFDTGSEKFTNYDAENGLQSTEFNTWAYYKCPDGKMIFGGVNGLTSFYPKEVKDNLHKPEILITDFNLMHKPVTVGYDSAWKRTILQKSITETRRIELNYDENVISFEIAVLDYKNPQKNKFRYLLEGFDKEWTDKNASQRFITYTNLNPGKYTFKVMGSNSDGMWNRKGLALTLIVNHPWWKTWWAYLIYIVFFGFVFTGSTRFYLNRKMLRNQLALEHEHAKKLADVDKLKSNFFTNISHEFRTPLTLIMGPSNNIINRSNDAEAVKQAELIKRNSSRLIRLINQLLDLSKLDEGKLKLHAAESNLVSFIRGVVMSFEAYAEKKDISLKVKSLKNEITMYFDQDKMDKIITNLLSNAIKFTPRGGNVTVKIIEKNDECVEILIRDTGVGISREEIPKLFDRFYQVDSSQTRQYEGSGLGLALTKELVELHHGKISVDSEVSSPGNGRRGGTEFKIVLPKKECQFKEEELCIKPEPAEKYEIAQEDEKYSSELEVESEYREIKNNKTIILIIEDNKDVREFIKELLDGDYHIEEAINGEQGVRKAERIIPDLIISDIMMPKLDGNQVTRKLKNDEKTSHIPVILLTAKSEHESKLEGLEVGADDYLTKPFEPDELKIRIKNLIESRRKLHDKFSRNEVSLNRINKQFSVLDQNFLNKVNAVIEKHLSEEEFSIEALGKEVNMSRSQVHRKLTAITGKSPSLYMRSARLARAKEMILERTGNISEIAYSVGFSSPAYFTKCFKEEFGIPPSEIINHSVS